MNGAEPVAPNGRLHFTGDYVQAAGGSLALDLRSAGDGDSLAVDGRSPSTGHCASPRPICRQQRRQRSCWPRPRSRPARSRRRSRPSRLHAPGLPAYGAGGVTLAVGTASAGGDDAPTSLSPPSLRPAAPGRRRAHPLPPRFLEGGAQTGLPVAARRQADHEGRLGALSRRSRRRPPPPVLPRDGDCEWWGDSLRHEQERASAAGTGCRPRVRGGGRRVSRWPCAACAASGAAAAR